MLSKLREYLEQRQNDKMQRQFDEGFGWAMAQHIIHRRNIKSIRATVKFDRDINCNRNEFFNDGIDFAVKFLTTPQKVANQ